MCPAHGHERQISTVPIHCATSTCTREILSTVGDNATATDDLSLFHIQFIKFEKTIGKFIENEVFAFGNIFRIESEVGRLIENT